MKFELTETQVIRLQLWKDMLREKHGRVGTFKFCFTETGIGLNLQITNSIERGAVDFSEYETW